MGRDPDSSLRPIIRTKKTEGQAGDANAGKREVTGEEEVRN
ncbi:uncharacterized protein G2W53_025475 [Senna tora]|uniref:Uncharacterized protein n=1 Tax=Senna tora TaxID=362788 RepID=A0A834TE02_9FABA|nr:uncharacterized protein G2W53_025475 [Senna tora]